MEFKYDSKHLGSGYYSCRSCDYVFISWLKPFHKENCPDINEGWDAATYNYGPSELKEIQENGRSSNNFNLTIEQLEKVKII